MDWHLFTEVSSFVVLLIAGATGYGKLQQKVKDMGKIIEDHEKKLDAHMEQLADGAGNFKVIDTKLDYISKSVDTIARQLTSHVGERHE